VISRNRQIATSPDHPMSELLPLFPLPDVVLFPGVFLPLHIFEARYREMVADALATDRLIGMTLLRDGWRDDYEGRPPVYPIGCSGLITHCEKLQDGRYNIVLRGLERFRIVTEDHERAYRRARTETLQDPSLADADRVALAAERTRLEALIQAADGTSGIDPRIASALTDEDLVNALAQYLELEPIEKQALLEQHGALARGRALAELLEMKMLMARRPGSTHAH
jgi:Lon protease-like protein